MNPRLATVIIPTLNAARFLAEALDSVFSGTMQPLEVLVVDGGSTDNTQAVALKYAGVRWIFEPEPGYGAALNRGIREASAPLLAFLEGDDIWLPRRLEAQFAFLDEHEGCAGCFGRVRRFIEPGCSAPAGFRAESLLHDLEAPLLSAALIHRGVFDRVGLFQSEYRSGADMDWLARANDAGIRFDYVPELLVRKRIHDSNVSSLVELSHRDIFKALRASVRRKHNAGSATGMATPIPPIG